MRWDIPSDENKSKSRDLDFPGILNLNFEIPINNGPLWYF